MARGIYTLSGDNITIANSAPLTLILLRPTAARGYALRRAWCSQRGTAAQQMLGIKLGYRTLTTVPTLTSKAPVATFDADVASVFAGGTAAAAGTGGINASAEGTGATTDVVVDNFNNVSGWLWFPSDPKGELVCVGGSATPLVMQLLTAPTTLTGWSFGFEIEER